MCHFDVYQAKGFQDIIDNKTTLGLASDWHSGWQVQYIYMSLLCQNLDITIGMKSSCVDSIINSSFNCYRCWHDMSLILPPIEIVSISWKKKFEGLEFINTYIKLFHSRFFASIIFGFKWFLHGLSGHWYNNKYFISINEILFFPMHPLRCRHGHGHYVNVLIINCNWTGLN